MVSRDWGSSGEAEQEELAAGRVRRLNPGALFAAEKYGTRMHLPGGDPDPLNPRKRVTPDGLEKGKACTQTWVELPGAAPQPYIEDLGIPRGEIRPDDRNSEILGYSRHTVTYLPPGYDPGHTYHMMILLDGTEYFEDGHLRLTLENLIAEGLERIFGRMAPR